MPSYYSSINNGSLIIPPADDVRKARVLDATGRQVRRFPENLGAHSVIMVFREYDFKSATAATTSSSTFNSFSKLKTADDKARGAVVLPLPTNLEDSYTVRLSGNDLEIAGQIRAQTIEGAANKTAALGGLNGIASDQSNWLRLAKTLGEEAKNSVKELLSLDVSNLSPGALLRVVRKRFNRNAGVGEAFGSVLNPFVALSFQGVDLKTHSFSWNLAPKTRRESEILNEIIKHIKKNAAPEYENVATVSNKNSSAATSNAINRVASRLLIKYPSMVDIWFTGVDPFYYYYFKRCMINSVAINFSPSGPPAILSGGKPAFVQLNMTLTETQIHTRNDYENLGGNGGKSVPQSQQPSAGHPQ